MDTNTIVKKLKSNKPRLFPSSSAVHFEEASINLQEDFVNTFPKLSNLVTQATILDMIRDNQHYRLFLWEDNISKEPYGLIMKKENDTYSLPFINEHSLILKNIGGIVEYFNLRDDHLYF